MSTIASASFGVEAVGRQDANELTLRAARGVVQHRAIQRSARAGGVLESEGDRAVPVLEEDQIAERRVLRAPRLDLAVGRTVAEIGGANWPTPR